MTSELLAVFDYYEREKGIPRSKMVDALSSAILTAARKNIGPARELRIDIDPAKGTIKAIAKLLVGGIEVVAIFRKQPTTSATDLAQHVGVNVFRVRAVVVARGEHCLRVGTLTRRDR